MTVEDILDAKVGSNQVTAIYLGSTLVWPTSGALTYVITGAQLNFSRGSALDAGEVDSDYSGNYAWVTGTVVPYRGDEPQTPLTNVMLVPTVTNTTDFVVRDTYYIYGHNLGTTPTSAIKETSVDVTYKTSDSFRVGSTVTQTRNIETITDGTPFVVDGTPYETVDPIAETYWIVMNLSQYGNRMYPCPAYGNPSVSLVCYGGHDEATFSHTPWQEFTPRIHSFSSGSSYTVNEETNYGEYPPVQVGQSEPVNDDLSENIELTYSSVGGSGWASYNYNSDTLTIDNAGTYEYELTRSVIITATNGDKEESVTAYQHRNILETVIESFDLSVAIRDVGTFPDIGGTFYVDYISRRTYQNEYTSGTRTPAATEAFTSDVLASYFITPSVNEVSGVGSFTIDVDANESYVSVRTGVVEIQAQDRTGQYATDSKIQDTKTVPATLEGITIVKESGDWVIGTIKTSQIPLGPVSGIIIARKSENVVDAHVTYGNIQWSYATNPGTTPPEMANFNDSGTQTMTGGVTLTVTPYGGEPHDYYGYWLITPTFPNGVTPRTLLAISSISTFTVLE